MPLGINGYNDAFKAFTDFATQAKSGSTFAQIGGEKNEAAGSSPLAGRTIVAKTGFDFVGNVGRRQASRPSRTCSAAPTISPTASRTR